MMLFRQADARYPFLWNDDRQPAGRWHAEGEGPAHYFADTPDGAWAEFLRHEEITDPEDVPTIRRQIWAVDVGEPSMQSVDLPRAVLAGGPDSYRRCQEEASSLRRHGATGLIARSAALVEGGARGLRVAGGQQVADAPRDGRVIVFFGTADAFVGWSAAVDAKPSADLLPRVHHYKDKSA